MALKYSVVQSLCEREICADGPAKENEHLSKQVCNASVKIHT